MLHLNITRCVFIHIGIPGQEKGAADLAADFPSMQVIAKCTPVSLFLCGRSVGNIEPFW